MCQACSDQQCRSVRLCFQPSVNGCLRRQFPRTMPIQTAVVRQQLFGIFPFGEATATTMQPVLMGKRHSYVSIVFIFFLPKYPFNNQKHWGRVSGGFRRIPTDGNALKNSISTRPINIILLKHLPKMMTEQ